MAREGAAHSGLEWQGVVVLFLIAHLDRAMHQAHGRGSRARRRGLPRCCCPIRCRRRRDAVCTTRRIPARFTTARLVVHVGERTCCGPASERTHLLALQQRARARLLVLWRRRQAEPARGLPAHHRRHVSAASALLGRRNGDGEGGPLALDAPHITMAARHRTGEGCHVVWARRRLHHLHLLPGTLQFDVPLGGGAEHDEIGLPRGGALRHEGVGRGHEGLQCFQCGRA